MRLSDDVRGMLLKDIRELLRGLTTESVIDIGDMVTDELTRRYEEGEP